MSTGHGDAVRASSRDARQSSRDPSARAVARDPLDAAGRRARTVEDGPVSRLARAERGIGLATYEDAWRWSVDEPGPFWQSIWDHFGVRSATPPGPALATRAMPGARWFPGATLNYAEHVLALPGRAADDVVILGRSQTRDPMGPDRRRAARRGRALPGRPRRGSASGGATGSRRSCRTSPRRSSALLATASLGAIWSSCAPEFGTEAVVDRLAQIEPMVLLAVDGYRYGDRERSTGPRRWPTIRAALPTLRATVVRAVPAARGRRPRRGPGRRAVVVAARRAGAARLRPRPVRPPAVGPVLVGHDRPAQADRPRSRRDPARAPQGPRAPHGPRRRATGSAGSPRPAG